MEDLNSASGESWDALPLKVDTLVRYSCQPIHRRLQNKGQALGEQPRKMRSRSQTGNRESPESEIRFWIPGSADDLQPGFGQGSPPLGLRELIHNQCYEQFEFCTSLRLWHSESKMVQLYQRTPYFRVHSIFHCSLMQNKLLLLSIILVLLMMKDTYLLT